MIIMLTTTVMILIILLTLWLLVLSFHIYHIMSISHNSCHDNSYMHVLSFHLHLLISAHLISSQLILSFLVSFHLKSCMSDEWQDGLHVSSLDLPYIGFLVPGHQSCHTVSTDGVLNQDNTSFVAANRQYCDDAQETRHLNKWIIIANMSDFSSFPRWCMGVLWHALDQILHGILLPSILTATTAWRLCHHLLFCDVKMSS